MTNFLVQEGLADVVCWDPRDGRRLRLVPVEESVEQLARVINDRFPDAGTKADLHDTTLTRLARRGICVEHGLVGVDPRYPVTEGGKFCWCGEKVVPVVELNRIIDREAEKRALAEMASDPSCAL